MQGLETSIPIDSVSRTVSRSRAAPTLFHTHTRRSPAKDIVEIGVMMIFPNLSLFEFDRELFNKKFLNIVSIFPIVEKPNIMNITPIRRREVSRGNVTRA